MGLWEWSPANLPTRPEDALMFRYYLLHHFLILISNSFPSIINSVSNQSPIPFPTHSPRFFQWNVRMLFYPFQVAGMCFQSGQQLPLTMQNTIGLGESLRRPNQIELRRCANPTILRNVEVDMAMLVRPKDVKPKTTTIQCSCFYRPSARPNFNPTSQIREMLNIWGYFYRARSR